jgi:tetratricopeptide (TPR) repeat protein
MGRELETPTGYEVKAQLVRMLAAKRFRNAERQSELLELVVERKLKGQTTTGQIIARALFPHKVTKTPSGKIEIRGNDVRSAANHLRETLTRYQAGEGREDLVVIALPDPPKDNAVKIPEGEAYTPRFFYNSNHAVGQEFALGEFHRSRWTIEDDFKALDHYKRVLKIAPLHIGANIGSAEVWVGLAYWDSVWGPPTDKEQSILAAAEFLDDIHRLVPKLWRVHAVGGFMLMANGDLQNARRAFADALLLDRRSTEAYPPYIFFLIAVGKTAEGLRLAKTLLDSRVTAMDAHVTYAFALVRANRLGDALAALQMAFAMEPGHKRVHSLLAQIYMAQQKPAEALRHLEYLHALVDSSTFTLILNNCKSLVEAWPDEIKREWAERGQVLPDRQSFLLLTER